MENEPDCKCIKIIGHLEAVKWFTSPRRYKPSAGPLALGDWKQNPHIWLHYVESSDGIPLEHDVLRSTDARYWCIHDVQRYFLGELHCEQVLFTYQYPSLKLPSHLATYLWKANASLKLPPKLYMKELHMSIEDTLKKMEMKQAQMNRLLISDQLIKIDRLDYFKRKTFFRILLNIIRLSEGLDKCKGSSILLKRMDDKLQLISFENLGCKRLEGVRLIQQLACFASHTLKYLFLWRFVLPNENPILINYSYITGSGQHILRPPTRQCFLRSLGELRELRILALEYAHIADGTGNALLSLLPVIRRPHFQLQLICRENQTPGKADASLGVGGYDIPDTAWRRVTTSCPDLYLFMAFFRIRDYDNVRRFITPSVPLREAHLQLGVDLTVTQRQDSDLSCFMRTLAYYNSDSLDFSQSKDREEGESSQRQEIKENDGASSITRTDSPDNDSAFSDTVSMLSSESSASSSASSKCKAMKLSLHPNQKKADKIKLALERMREANVKKLFIKAFSMDGSSKSLLVDEKMTCGYVTRLLADKNHVTMEPKWAIVENLPDLHMERVYEDHEMLVDNLMLWTRESKNKIMFAERPDKISLFQSPEKFLLNEDEIGFSEYDEHLRQVIIEEFFGQSGVATTPSVSGHPVPPMEGPLYLKSDAKKGWKKYYFVLRPSGLYYLPKDKVKTLKELVCLATFDTNEVYLGVNWKKKYKSPTDYCFAIKHPRLQQPKSVKFIKFLCADDQRTLERWITAMRIAKHGRQLLDNHRSLVEELTQEDLDHLAHARSCSITSIPTKTNGTAPGVPAPVSSNASVANSDISSGRHSRASSSSSSGCLSDGGTASESAFDCEFPMGTIKRKPSMKPNIPLTWMTRQLKEMVENEGDVDPGDSGTLTRRPRTRDDSTLKRHHSTATESSEPTIYSTGSITSSSPVRDPPSPTYGHYETITHEPYRASVDTASSLYGYTIYDSAQPQPETTVEDLPLPPPPTDAPDGMFSSTLSLDSLPPPPPPVAYPIEDMNGSQLSLPPPPPEHTIEPHTGRVQDIVSQLTAQQIEQTGRAGQRNSLRSSDSNRSFPRQPSLDSVNSETSKTSSLHSDKSIYGQQNVAYGACLVELQTKKISNGSPSIQKKTIEPVKERTGSIKKVNFADDLPTCADKKTKKISFNLADAPPSPRKPPPPKRNESTRLSSPKKLADSNSNPPKDFLKDLQRVMRKKWQVAQKCKLEPATTPHEVLGFREYPLSDDYKETSVSMWVQEHYGGGSGVEDPFYENVFGREAPPRREEPKPIKKRPPPAPPRRSDSTHLSTHPGIPPPSHPSAVQPTA